MAFDTLHSLLAPVLSYQVRLHLSLFAHFICVGGIIIWNIFRSYGC